MKKKWLSALTLAATVSVVAACGNDNEPNEGNTEGNNNNEATETQQEEPAEDNESANEVAMEGEEGAQPDMPEPDLEGIPDVVAEVNGEEISGEEFEATYSGQFQQMTMQMQMTGEEVDQEQLKAQTVEEMIGTELLIQEANSGGYDATEEDINETLDEIAAQSGMESQDQFLAALEDQGMDEEEVMSQVETQVKIDQLLASETGDAEPSDEELEQLYDEMVAQQEQMGGAEGEETEIPSFEEMKPELENHVQAEKEAEAAQTLVEDLREDADVTVHL
ncbi:peptidylprolyl isomerase [Salipaludibacillus keqinensis]|jgi:hypothetical protein|uniref:peptidylprolyl isomerase n=1 Tax=Salipaludibacillus keqinensis TaxID=2045207 RepID=A0A323TIL7_9BACI|nr:SurA N-terminal domain-containing protein [Salipaludibacillus keqinensis]PYZ94972.1 peptidylprolyl isomerase [Salipaludibacillus keqinensis]